MRQQTEELQDPSIKTDEPSAHSQARAQEEYLSRMTKVIDAKNRQGMTTRASVSGGSQHLDGDVQPSDGRSEITPIRFHKSTTHASRRDNCTQSAKKTFPFRKYPEDSDNLNDDLEEDDDDLWEVLGHIIGRHHPEHLLQTDSAQHSFRKV